MFFFVALHEPYVLAFEPTFVEIRHIETGLLSQVIQGSNLRLLFADTPPTITNNTPPVHHSPYHHQPPPPGYDYNSYANSPNYGGSPYGGGYVQHPPPFQNSLPNAHLPPQHIHAHSHSYPHNYAARPPAPPQGVGRDEILIVSDDRVLALRTAAGPQRHLSDSASMMSIPR